MLKNKKTCEVCEPNTYGDDNGKCVKCNVSKYSIFNIILTIFYLKIIYINKFLLF